MSKRIEPPEISRPPEVYNYLGKFTLKKGDQVQIKSQSYYIDSKGRKCRAGLSGLFVFVCAVSSGILVREPGSNTTQFAFMGEEKTLELTGSVLKPHILKIPKQKRIKSDNQTSKK